jgi:hypothetical protein
MNQPDRMRDHCGIAALIIYAALSAVFFGRSLPGAFAANHLGRGNDPSFLMWALVWWPYAIAHRLNPFLCRIVWAPTGFNLAWSGSIPLASIIAAPITARLGPVAAYNVLCLFAPALAAWCAFLLCVYVTKRWLPAMIGGFVFGFSSYVLGQLAGGHLNLLFVFPAPLIVLLVLLKLDSRIRCLMFVRLAALAFAVEFLLSIELAATLVLFGAIAIAIVFIFADPNARSRIGALLVPLAWAGIAASAILSPYFYYLFSFGVPQGAINSPGAFSADFLNFVIPTRTVEFGEAALFHTVAARFPGNFGETGAYLGIPILATIVLHGFSHWRDYTSRMLVVTFAVICMLALGPRLHVGGWTAFGMPWKLFTHVPILKSALPVRFMNYAFLAAAVIVSIWLADKMTNFVLRCVLGILVVLLSFPNLCAAIWTAPSDLPAFFSAGTYTQYLHAGETVIALPYAITGNSMLWQAESRMYFRMAGGYTGITPREFERWPIVGAFSSTTYIPHAAIQLRAFMAAHDADAVIIDDRHLAQWVSLLSTLDSSPVRVGGVSLYRVALHDLAQYRGLNELELERRNNDARFTTLVAAAQKYLDQGRDPAALTPMHAQELGLLPQNWVNDPDVRTRNGLYLGPWNRGQIAVGVVGSYDALQPLIAKYRDGARHIFFPYPKELGDPPKADTFMRQLVIVFDRPALAHAASRVSH